MYDDRPNFFYHLYNLRECTGAQPFLQQLMKKYGRRWLASMVFGLFHVCAENFLQFQQIHRIALLSPHARNHNHYYSLHSCRLL